VKIAFLADFENDGWKETKYMDQKAGNIAVMDIFATESLRVSKFLSVNNGSCGN